MNAKTLRHYEQITYQNEKLGKLKVDLLWATTKTTDNFFFLLSVFASVNGGGGGCFVAVIAMKMAISLQKNIFCWPLACSSALKFWRCEGPSRVLKSSDSSKSTDAKQLARHGVEQNLPLKQKQRPLPLLLSPSFFYGQAPTAAKVADVTNHVILIIL